MITDQPMSEAQRWIELMIPGADSGLALFTPEGHENRIGEQFEKEPKKESWGTTAIFKDADENKFVLSSR